MALVVLALFLVLRVFEPVPFERLRAQLFDALHVLEPRERQALPVIIVDIDERSLAKYGQWPWPRNLMARLIDRVAETQPLSIGFDILFAEPDRYSPHLILSDHDDIHPDIKKHLTVLPSNDTILAKSLARTKTVLGIGALLSDEKTASTRRVLPIPVVSRGAVAKATMFHFPTALQSIRELDLAATSRATLNGIPSFDGVVRRVPLVIDVGGTITPTMALEMLRLAIGAPFFSVHSDKHGIRGVSLDDVFIPTESDGRIWVNYSRPDANLYVSAADILGGTVDPAVLAGKLVLVGSTGLGLTNTKATPVTPRMNGIEIHAQILESIITDEHLIRPIYADWLELGLAAGFGLFLILFKPFLSGKWTSAPLLLLVCLLVIFVAISWVAHAEFRLRIDTSFAAVSSLTIFVFLHIASYLETGLQRSRIRRSFQYYLSKEVIDQMVASNRVPELGGEERELTVLFSDIQGYSAIAEPLTPRELVSFLNKYLSLMAEIIEAHGGFIDKYIGDAVVAVFGAPNDDPQHAAHAVQAALDCEATLRANQDRFNLADGVTVLTRFGINTGTMLVGNIGSERRFNYTVMGDAVNLAARLESANKQYGSAVLVSRETAQRCADSLQFRELDAVRVVGRDQPVSILEPLGKTDSVSPEITDRAARYEAALVQLRAREFDMARNAFKQLADEGDQAAEKAVERVASLQTIDLPDDWDGVTNLDQK